MNDLERSLLDAEGVQPEADMRARVLAAAMPLVRADYSRLDSVWFSPRWRTAAALAFIAFVAIEILSPRIVGWAPVDQGHRATSAVQIVASAARDAGLTEDETAVIVAQAIDAQRAKRN